jgi:hypothetical protein
MAEKGNAEVIPMAKRRFDGPLGTPLLIWISLDPQGRDNGRV